MGEGGQKKQNMLQISYVNGPLRVGISSLCNGLIIACCMHYALGAPVLLSMFGLRRQAGWLFSGSEKVMMIDKARPLCAEFEQVSGNSSSLSSNRAA